MRVVLPALAAILMTPAPAAAQVSAAIAEARAQGLVGERFDGYLAIVGDAGDQLRHQVQAINIRRRAL